MEIVQEVQNYLYINFQQDTVNSHEVINVFLTVLIIAYFFNFRAVWKPLKTICILAKHSLGKWVNIESK